MSVCSCRGISDQRNSMQCQPTEFHIILSALSG